MASSECRQDLWPHRRLTKLGPIWLLGLGVEKRFVVVAAEQEGEPVEVAA